MIPERHKELYESSKDDRTILIGSDIRVLCSELGTAEEKLRECRQIQAYLRSDKVIAAAKIEELEHDVSEWSSAALDYQRQIEELNGSLRKIRECYLRGEESDLDEIMHVTDAALRPKV